MKNINNNKPAIQKPYRLPKVSWNTKYTVSLLAFLYILTVGYSSLIIYQNKHNHDGSHFDLFSFLTGRESKFSKLKHSDTAKQAAKQNAQYNTPAVVPKQDEVVSNAQKLVIISFYGDYLNNKMTGQSQTSTLAKYGTANLASQYKNGTPAKDVLTCLSDLDASANIIPTQEIDSPNPTYSVSFQNNQKKQLSYASVNLVQNNDSYAIDSVACPQ